MRDRWACLAALVLLQGACSTETPNERACARIEAFLDAFEYDAENPDELVTGLLEAGDEASGSVREALISVTVALVARDQGRFLETAIELDQECNGL